MARFLVKVEGKQIDYVSVKKGWSMQDVRKEAKTKGFNLKGYRLVNGKTHNAAITKRLQQMGKIKSNEHLVSKRRR